MTDDRSLERAARSFIEEGPTQAPDRAVEAALLRIQTTPQERDQRVPWRFPSMTTPARVAVAERLHLPSSAADESALLRDVARHSGRPAEQVRTLLADDAPVPSDDATLIALANQLAALQREVRRP